MSVIVVAIVVVPSLFTVVGVVIGLVVAGNRNDRDRLGIEQQLRAELAELRRGPRVTAFEVRGQWH